MSKLMRSISGIRGIVGDTLTPQVLQSHVRAFLEITQAKRIVIGRDSRPTGDAIVQYVAGICRLRCRRGRCWPFYDSFRGNFDYPF